MDLRLAGVTSTTSARLKMYGSGLLALGAGEVRRPSVNLALRSGSLEPVGAVVWVVNELSAAYAYLRTGTVDLKAVGIGPDLAFFNAPYTAGPSCAHAEVALDFTWASGAVIDFTVRIAEPYWGAAGANGGWSAEGGRGLVFADEFDRLDLTTPTHTGLWRPNEAWQDPGKGFADFAGVSWNISPTQHPAHTPFSVANSVLSITMRKTPDAIRGDIAAVTGADKVPDWSGGYLVLDNRVRTVRHGYIEWRARWPQPGRGMFPALWLFTAAGAFNDPEGKGRSEIDVFEIFGHGAGRPFSGTLHLASNSLTPLEVVDLYARDVDTAGWHTYGLDWQPGHLRFFYDNYLIRQVTGRVAEWFTSPMDLRMNFSMNPPWGSAAQQSDASTPAVMTMDIDYVRVFEQK